MGEPRTWGRIHWRIGAASGVGEPVPLDVARRWALALCRAYGRGTHWVERVDLEAEVDLGVGGS